MRNTRYAVVPVIAGSLMLAGCGGNSDSSSDSSSSSSNGTASSASSSAGSKSDTTIASASDCPTDNTRSFAKTRFVADVGFAAGSFHRWIYKPYKAGKFQKGAKGRTLALAKAAGTAALDAKAISNATKNVKANPTLCKKLGVPMSKLNDQLSGLGSKIKSGDLASIATTQGLVSSIMSGAKSSGLNINETTKNPVGN